MKVPSRFTNIIQGELHAHRVYEDDRVIAFLTHEPIARGHTLVVPKEQIDQIWDMDPDDYDYLWKVARKIGIHMKQVFNSPRVAIVIEGFNVPHVHIHLFPIYRRGEVQNRERLSLSEEELSAIASRLLM